MKDNFEARSFLLSFLLLGQLEPATSGLQPVWAHAEEVEMPRGSRHNILSVFEGTGPKDKQRCTGG